MDCLGNLIQHFQWLYLVYADGVSAGQEALAWERQLAVREIALALVKEESLGRSEASDPVTGPCSQEVG